MSSPLSSTSSREDFGDHRQNSNENVKKELNANEVQMKYLLPGLISGSVIGKGGERIAKLQNETQTKMKMSKSGDYFPGTEERVCLVTGQIANLLSVYQFLSEKIEENTSIDVLRSRQIKLIIPNSTAGLIIGKAGSTIQTIKQQTTTSLTITAKSHLNERILTISGDDGNRLKALEMILNKLLEDPNHHYQTNVNYSNERIVHHQMFVDKCNPFPFSANVSYESNALQRLTQLINNAGGTNSLTMDSLQNSLISFGYRNGDLEEIVQSISILIHYGLITIGNFSPHNLNCANRMFSSSSQRHHSEENSCRTPFHMNSKRFKSDPQRYYKSKR